MMVGDDRLHAMALAATARLGGLGRAGLAMLGPAGAAAVPPSAAAGPRLRVPDRAVPERRPALPAKAELAGMGRVPAAAPSFVPGTPATARLPLPRPREVSGTMRPAHGTWPAPAAFSAAAEMAEPAAMAPASAPAIVPPTRLRVWVDAPAAAGAPGVAAAAPGVVPGPVARTAVSPAEGPPAAREPPLPGIGPADGQAAATAPPDDAGLAHWLGMHLDEAARRPPRGGTGFDPRLSPGWPGTLQGPWGWGG